VIFIDANIPMYLVGPPHRHKTEATRLLEQAAAKGERLVTDVEVLQEILHRYAAIDRRQVIQDAFDALDAIVDDVFPIDLAGIELAKSLVLGYTRLSAGDALHVATMRQHGVTRIMSFDAGFDGMPGIVRIGA
jgi:predicted nucleic acid-binding protein